MIVDKHPQAPIQDTKQDVRTLSQPLPEAPGDMDIMVNTNVMVEAYLAVRKILEGIKVDPADPDSPRYFKTIKLDNGQLSRIKYNIRNQEYGIAFPAVFIHFIDVYATVGVANIAGCKGVMRIHYVLNKLNNSDDEVETEGLVMYKRIVDAIESNKSKFPALVTRFQLQYWDQPLTFDDGVQPYWIDYQIWFEDFTAYRYKDFIDVYATAPPFTQHSDQNEIANPDHLPDDKEPRFEDCAGIDDTQTTI